MSQCFNLLFLTLDWFKLVDIWCEFFKNERKLIFFIDEEVMSFLFTVLELTEWTSNQLFVIFKLLPFLESHVYYFLLILHNLTTLNELGAHFQYLGVQTQIWKPIAVVLFKTTLEIFLKGFIL